MAGDLVLTACGTISSKPGNAMLCTDDREPGDLLRGGHIDDAVRVREIGGGHL